MPLALPSPLLTFPPTRLIFSTAYHPYAPTERSSYSSNTTTPASYSLWFTILMLLQHPQDMPTMLPPHLHAQPSAPPRNKH
ncbi:hypothetical protein O181_073650 [Austropuccinia psidii MF-1]|uniref:Uncharacterized protein n=1 Tax=Austropuccinia psidii MF-1 TaxID=1389203 RepID=A0A9Q3IC86_9BASI|nr:hypothetical protein [Austropuccinia psidii MF-1]